MRLWPRVECLHRLLKIAGAHIEDIKSLGRVIGVQAHMGDDLFRQIHEQMVEKYLDLHPETSWDQAYDRCSLPAYEEYCERIAEQVDELRKRRMNGG